MSDKGVIQVYTGDGKGKTTAAIGLAVRAVGAGKKVFIGQFVKGLLTSEVKTINQFIPHITVKQYGSGNYIVNTPSPEDVFAARKGLSEVTAIIGSGDYDMVILDEINIALHYNLFTVNEVVGVLNDRPEHVDVVLTGRNAPQELIDMADLVTEMKEVKHYFKNGVEAREGIEF